MVRGECLPVRVGREMMGWKYDDDCCGYGKSKQKNMCCLTATDMEKSE